MNTVKIGLMDNELQYVERLSAYLNRHGNRLWKVAAFTDNEVLMRYMKEKRIDLLAATDRSLLCLLNEKYPGHCYVWLADEKGNHSISVAGQKIYSVYRYQSAKAVGDFLKDIVEYIGLVAGGAKTSAVIYSPVGRCGKTMLAMDFLHENTGGKWLYVGMEDYCGGPFKNENAEDFLYYIKERCEEDVLKVLAECDGRIPSPFSMFDTKQIDREDIDWFLKLFEKENMYRGVIFDMGTGIPDSLNIMLSFDHIIVPFLQEESALSKRKHFEELIAAYELYELKDKLHYVDMGTGSAVEDLKKILA